MTSTSARPSDSPGSFSRENAPRIVVRAERHFLCTACGTLVEIPADVVGQMVLAAVANSQEEPATESTTREPVAADLSRKPAKPPATVQRSRTTSNRPAQPNRPPQPRRKTFVNQQIDGLVVPSGKQLDRALSWVSFHLKVLDRQGSEIGRLKKLLKKPATPCSRPPGHAKDADHSKVDRACGAKQTHSHADVGIAPENQSPGTNPTQERGPPD